jgi:uncharacterized membrane protein (UPF0127 family)
MSGLKSVNGPDETFDPVPGYQRMAVYNKTKRTQLADRAAMATTPAQKNQGLLKHKTLPQGDGLWIKGTNAVHTFFMKFPIDLVYLTKDKKVVKTRHAVPAWRLSMAFGAASILELPAGVVKATGTEPGDQLEFIAMEGSQA